MSSDPFSIVPCSSCSGTTLLKTALIWKESVFCSVDCLRNYVDSVRVNNEPIKKKAHDNFFKPVSRLSDAQAVQAIGEDRHFLI
ncbi:hypothetical protein [Methylobacter tundripaludum]|uniref:hypothetical protein n=1 Tax=Methylobacter tundripaludum TaxID=173365 RepID=UPI0012375F35|nr:hypothetical protein [Methylobacter tundripaludum]